MPPKTTKEAEELRAQLIGEMLPDGVPEIDEAELLEAMDKVMETAGLPMALRHAVRKTQRIVSVENMHLLSPEECAEWDAAVEEGEALYGPCPPALTGTAPPSRRVRRGLPRWRR